MSDMKLQRTCRFAKAVGLSAALILAANPGGVYAQGTSNSNGSSTQSFTTLQPISTTILPTDVSSWGGERGFVNGRSHLQGPPDLAAWLFHGQAQSVERDARYSFTGVWSYFGQIDSFLSMLEDKVPALQKVSGELKTPCGNIPQSMPPVPDLPSPEKVGKSQAAADLVIGNQYWQPLIGTGPVPDKARLRSGKLQFSHACQAYSGGSSASNANLVVGTPGTQVVARSWSNLSIKAGRAFLSNGASSGDFIVESGRVRAVLPLGASGIIDTAPNGLTRYMAMTDSAGKQAAVYDACNPSLELAKLDAGELITVAQEDAVAEDLIPPTLLAETIEQGRREEGYLLVKGRFSLKDALNKDIVFGEPAFESNAQLQEQKRHILVAADQHPWQQSKTKVLTASVQSAVPTGQAHAKGEASFMPTRGARYGRVSNNELLIADGAVLVKGGDSPVIVSTEVNRQKVMVNIKSGAVVMVSALDGRATVLNLTDSSPGSCTFYLPGESGKPYETVSVGTGQVAEFYIDDGLEPASTVVSYRVIDKKNLPGKVGVLIAKYDYLAAMKRFNLSFALPMPDLNRVMKTMAASAYLMRARSEP
jgi:hypothetical protein